MHQWTQKVRKLTSDLFDIPKDVALNIPRITLIGTLQLYVENHQGVSHFSHEKLKLRVHDGELQIVGENLKIRSIHTEDVLVEGKITGLTYTESGGS